MQVFLSEVVRGEKDLAVAAGRDFDIVSQGLSRENLSIFSNY